MPSGLVTQNGDGVAIPATNKVVISTSVSVLINNIGIAFVQNLNRNDRRQVLRLRHLDHLDAGRTVEQAAGPEDHTLRMSGFACYGDAGLPGGQSPVGSMVDRALGAAGIQQVGALSTRTFRTLSSQIIPFDVFELRQRPGAAASNRTIFHENVMSDNTSPVQIGQITIAEEIAMQPTFIT